MRRILITGADSYIGTSFEHYVAQWPEKYHVDTIDMRGDVWQQASFAGYDSVFHVAGIAHADVGKVTEKQKALYYKVNTDLTIKTAVKAKADGVRQFIYMSSAIVYGDSAPIGKEKIITRDTKPAPANFYGDSKLKAEEGILPLQSTDFNVVVLRPPMIYGKGSKGNFQILEKIALKLPIFPKISNTRSLLYIDHLVEFVRLMVENEEYGIFWPCNKESCSTSDLVTMIAEINERKILFVPGLGLVLRLISRLTGLVDKAFGSLVYEEHLGDYKEEYRHYSLIDSIKEIGGKNAR